MGKRYLDTPKGLVVTEPTHAEEEDIRATYAAWSKGIDVYQLVLKENKKELNPSRFDNKEKEKFDKADMDEWRQWILNGAVERVSPEKEKQVSTKKIITAPMRYVRKNKDKDGGLEAKSRLVIPGHTDPQIGLYRTDAPTTSHVSVMLCSVVAVCLGWSFAVFDVSTAFLSGLAMTREVYAKAPREGLPAAEGWEAVPPFSLLRLLKGAYGLTEAPRLWYLRARQILTKLGFEEIRCARAAFVFRKAGRLIALLTLHVDDGMLFGNPVDKEYMKMREAINQNFKIKHWKAVGKEPVDYLGMQWVRRSDEVEINMDTYIKKIEKIKVDPKEDDERELSPHEETEFKSALQKIRWPVAHVVPELAYTVSALAQGSEKKVLHLRAVSEATDKLKELQARGCAKIILRPIPLEILTVLTIMDASFAKEEGMKSQMGFLNIVADSQVKEGPSISNLVEFQSTTISRVVRSTMAAESASLSQAVDRQLYLRLVIENILHGEPDLGKDWRMSLKVPGIIVTDAKSMFDHLGKSGSVPVERQTLIDLLVARDLHENGAVSLRWLPNTHMLADILTKAVKPNEVYQRFRDRGLYSLVPTAEQEQEEDHILVLRQGQRQRAKERKKQKAGC